MALDEKDLRAISELLDCKFEKELRPIKEDISGLKEDVSSLQCQMNHMEDKVDEMDDRLKRVEHNQEQEMFRMNMLYETFIPTSRVTKLEEKIDRIGDDVAIMKIALKELASSVSRERGNGFCAATI